MTWQTDALVLHSGRVGAVDFGSPCLGPSAHIGCFNLHEQTEKAEAEACLADEWARGDYMYLHT